MMESFEMFQIVYLILEELYYEKNNDNLGEYLSDANPFMRQGENSADPAVYVEFKDKFENVKNSNDYYYEFVCEYLKYLDYYKEIYEIFTKSLTKEEYVLTVENILNHKDAWLKR